jgi:hypothetical protein
MVISDAFVSTDLTSQLESFYGTGQIGRALDEFAFFTELSPFGAIAFPIRGDDSGTLTITYNFIAPEPSGYIMFGTASLIGLGCWLRCRKPLSVLQARPFPGRRV